MKKLSWKALFIVVIAFVLYNCKTLPSEAQIENLEKVVEMEKGPCFGDCPMFTLTVYANGLVQYRGEEYTDKEGTHLKTISQNDLRKLIKAFRDTNFFGFENAYPSNIPDRQTVTITFYDDNQVKTVAGKDNRPEQLLALQQLLDEIAESEDWTAKASDDGEQAVNNEIIVRLRDGVNTEDWLDKYQAQKVQVKEVLSPSGSYLLITFDAEIIVPDEMLDLVRQDGEVIGAEFNREVDLR